MKIKKYLVTITLTLIIMFTLLITSLYLTDTTIPEDILKTITMFPTKIALSKENTISQDESYLIQKNINETLVNEVEELKKLLDLNKTITEYTPVNATITSRNKSYWFNTLNIDKGRKDGLKKDMAVITKNGLIGKISKVYSSYSEVKLITADDINNKVSVAIKSNDRDIYAILNGYDHKNNLLKVIWVDKDATIEKNTVVTTSGLGEKFPAGIYIGTVEKIESDKYNLSKTIYIKTKQDFNNIHYVTVLKEKK